MMFRVAQIFRLGPILTGAAILLALAAPALAQDGQGAATDPHPRIAGLTLDDAELRRVFSGADLEGCYPDMSIWAERTTAAGDLYDLLRTGAPRVGRWWVADDQICYAYDGSHGHAPGTWCWHVIRQGGDLYFVFPGTDRIGGGTACGDLIA